MSQSNSIINSLKRLERVGSETSVVTEKLRHACYEVADKIVDVVQQSGMRNGSEKFQLPRGYHITTSCWNSGQFQDELLIGTISAVNTQLGDDYHPGGDYHSIYPGTKREQCLQFAKDISEGLLDEIAAVMESEKNHMSDATKEIDQAIAE